MLDGLFQPTARAGRRSEDRLAAGQARGNAARMQAPRSVQPARHDEWYEQIVRVELAPLLREYWFDDLGRAEEIVAQLLSDD